MDGTTPSTTHTCPPARLYAVWRGVLAWHNRSTRKVSYIAMIHPERDARNYAARQTGKKTPNQKKKTPNENVLLLPITEANNELGSLLQRGYNELVADVRIS